MGYLCQSISIEELTFHFFMSFPCIRGTTPEIVILKPCICQFFVSNCNRLYCVCHSIIGSIIRHNTWPTFDSSKSRFLLQTTRLLRKLIVAISRHCNFCVHAYRLEIQHHCYCSSCQNISIEELPFHFLCHFFAFEELRLRSLSWKCQFFLWAIVTGYNWTFMP